MAKPVIDLNASASPEEALSSLMSASEFYMVDASELDAAHQDPTAGNAWRIIAGEIEEAHRRAMRRIARTGYPLNKDACF